MDSWPCRWCGQSVHGGWVRILGSEGAVSLLNDDGAQHNCPRREAIQRQNEYRRLRHADRVDRQAESDRVEGLARARTLRDLTHRVNLLSDAVGLGIHRHHPEDWMTE